MNKLDFDIKMENLDKITAENAIDHEKFVDEINYLIEEGFIEIEQGVDGEVRVYPTT